MGAGGDVLGREAEVARLRAAVDRATAGRPTTVLVEGEAGMGATTLVDATAGHAAERGFTVARGAADALDSERPFGPLVDALALTPGSPDPERRAVADLLATPPPAGTQGVADQVADCRYRVVDAICALVDRLAGQGPTALVLDDLQWADHSTGLVLRRLASTLGVPLLVLASCRPHRADGDGLLAHHGVEVVPVGPLAPREATGLVAARAGGAPGPRLRRLAEGAAGNPLLLTELVAGLRAAGGLVDRGGVVEASALGIDPDPGRQVRQRVAHLGPTAQAVLEVAAVLGRRSTVSEVAATGGWGPADLAGPLDELAAAGLLAVDRAVDTAAEGTGAGSSPPVDLRVELGFRHDMLRRAVEEAIAPIARRALHRAAGRARAEAGAPAARVARHLAAGAEVGDEEAVAWLRRAATEAAPRDPRAAVDLLGHALRLVDDEPTRLALATARVEALGWAGRSAEAAAEGQRLVAATDDPALRVRLRRQRALALILQGRAVEAAAACAESAAELEGDPAARAQALAEASLAHLAGAQLASAAAVAAEAVAAGEEHGNPVATCVARAVRSRLAACAGDLPAALAEARAAMAAQQHDPTGQAHRYQPGLFEAMALLDLGRPDEAARSIAHQRAEAEAHGVVWALPLHHAGAATCHLLAGELASAATEAVAGLTVVEDSGSDLATVWCRAALALVALHRGDDGAATRHLAEAEAAAPRGAALLGADLQALAQIRRAEARRDVAGAAALALVAWRLFTGLRIVGGPRQVLAVDALRLALVVGDREGAAEVAADLAAPIDLDGRPSDPILAELAAALLAGEPGRLHRALAGVEATPHRLRAAAAGEAAAPVLRAAGDRRGAGDVLARAQRTYVALDAAGDLRRVSALLTALGVGRPAPPAPPRRGWDALTGDERRVAELVASGAANREVAEALGLPRRTVEAHLGHIYATLGVSSRRELGAVVPPRR